MGTVYLAQHSVMGWPAAIKVLRGSLADDKVLVRRFINEARIIRAVRHPNIVEILDIGLLPDGRPYLLMELLEGETLGERLGRCGRLGVAPAIDIVRQTALALAEAHAKGITHRDLKPDNLFLLRDPDDPKRDKVKVLDFGIAKLRDDGRGPSAHTRSGVLLGTPAYMSPEQCQGIAAAIDHRSDIYALSVILYQMLAGKAPFVSAGMGDVLIMHVSTEAPRIRQESPAVPVFVEDAILRGMAKPREQRFASMTELADALLDTPVASTAPVATPAPPAVEPLRAAVILESPASMPTRAPNVPVATPISWSGTPRSSRSTTWSTQTPSRRAMAVGLSAAIVGAVIVVAAGRRMGRDRDVPAAATMTAPVDLTRVQPATTGSTAAPIAVAPATPPVSPVVADAGASSPKVVPAAANVAPASAAAPAPARKPARRPRTIAPLPQDPRRPALPAAPPPTRKAKPWL